jgi:hypothetical protein
MLQVGVPRPYATLCIALFLAFVRLSLLNDWHIACLMNSDLTVLFFKELNDFFVCE